MPCQKLSSNITIRETGILMRFFRGKEVRDISFRVGSAVLWSLSRPSVPGIQIMTQWKHILWELGSTSENPHKVYVWILLSTALFLHPPMAKGADRLNLLLFKNRCWPSIYLHQGKKKYPSSSNEMPWRILPEQMWDGDLTIKKTFHLSY